MSTTLATQVILWRTWLIWRMWGNVWGISGFISTLTRSVWRATWTHSQRIGGNSGSEGLYTATCYAPVEPILIQEAYSWSLNPDWKIELLQSAAHGVFFEVCPKASADPNEATRAVMGLIHSVHGYQCASRFNSRCWLWAIKPFMTWGQVTCRTLFSFASTYSSRM